MREFTYTTVTNKEVVILDVETQAELYNRIGLSERPTEDLFFNETIVHEGVFYLAFNTKKCKIGHGKILLEIVKAGKHNPGDEYFMSGLAYCVYQAFKNWGVEPGLVSDWK